MDHFDQLIKEKAEKKVFKYKPLFWLLFAKSAGFSAFSMLQIISGVIVITGVVGGSSYFGIKNYQKKHPERNPKNRIDTSYQHPSKPDPNTLIIDSFPVENNSKNIEEVSVKNVPQKSEPIQIKQSTLPYKEVKDTIPSKKISNDPYLGRRILTIDPDTILTND